MTVTFKIKFNFKVKIYPILSLWVCLRDKSPLIEIRISKFGPKMHLSTVKVPIDFGLDWPWSSVSFLISNLCFSTKHCVSHSFALVCIYLDHRQWMLHIPQGTAHIWILICTWTGSPRGMWNSLVLYLGGTIGAQWAVDSAIGTGFYKLLSGFANLYTPHMTQSYRPTIGNHRNNSKRAPISLIWFDFHCVASGSVGSGKHARHRDTGYPVCSTF